MPAFFTRAFPELVYLGPEPDRVKNAGESQDADNLPEHQIDIEFTDGMPLPPSRYEFIGAMAQKNLYARHGISYDDPGFLPWRIAELSQLLQKEFALWRVAEPGDRRALEHEIVVIAGLLGHYTGDAANPHHTTIHYNGWVEPNPEHFATDCETHARFETQYVSHALEISDVTPRMPAPLARTDYFAAGLELIHESNGLLRTLYTIDRDGGFDLFRPIDPKAKAFTASRLAAGSALLRDLWWSAWKNSATQPPRHPRTSS